MVPEMLGVIGTVLDCALFWGRRHCSAADGMPIVQLVDEVFDSLCKIFSEKETREILCSNTSAILPMFANLLLAQSVTATHFQTLSGKAAATSTGAPATSFVCKMLAHACLVDRTSFSMRLQGAQFWVNVSPYDGHTYGKSPIFSKDEAKEFNEGWTLLRQCLQVSISSSVGSCQW